MIEQPCEEPDSHSLAALLEATKGDGELLARLIESGEGPFSDPTVREACRKALEDKQGIIAIDSILNRSTVTYQNVVTVLNTVSKKRTEKTKINEMKKQVKPLKKALRGLKSEIQSLQETLKQVRSVRQQVQIMESDTARARTSNTDIARLLARHRRLHDDIEELRHTRTELEEAVRLHRVVMLL